MHIKILILCITMVCSLHLPAFAQVTPPIPDNATTVVRVNEADKNIDERIEAILQQLNGMGDVRVRVSAGVVSLTGEVAEINQIQEAEDIATRIEGVIAVRNNIQQVDGVSEQIEPAIDRMLERATNIALKLPIILVALLVFVFFIILGLWVARKSLWNKLAPNGFIADLIRQIIRLIFMGIGVVAGLDIMGATALLSTLLGAAGIVGLAVGFAVRDTVENYIASILLSLRQPFRPNDFVTIAGESGTVVSLTSRATVLISADGNHVRIPNATVFKGTITNFSRNPDRRFSFIVSIAPDSQIDFAIQTGIEALAAADFTKTAPAPNAWVETIGASTIDIFYCAWIDQTVSDFARSRSAAIHHVIQALSDASISMPEPSYRIITDQTDIESKAAKKRPASKTVKPKAEPAQTIDTKIDTTMTDIAEEEREKSPSNNLLSDDAPQEI